METPANVSPPEFVMYCLERGYYLENRDAGVCFAPHCDPPRKAKAYLDTYQKEIAGLLQRDKSPSPSASAITVNVVSDVNIPVLQLPPNPLYLPCRK